MKSLSTSVPFANFSGRDSPPYVPFLNKLELHVEAQLHRTLYRLEPQMSGIDRRVLEAFGDLCPEGPMMDRSEVPVVVVSDSSWKDRLPSEIIEAFRKEDLEKGDIWHLVWLLFKTRGSMFFWEQFQDTVAIGSPFDTAFGRRFPIIRGSVGMPLVSSISEDCLGESKRNLRFLGCPAGSPPLRLIKSAVAMSMAKA